jgi:hypothetical protein
MNVMIKSAGRNVMCADMPNALAQPQPPGSHAPPKPWSSESPKRSANGKVRRLLAEASWLVNLEFKTTNNELSYEEKHTDDNESHATPAETLRGDRGVWGGFSRIDLMF